MKTYLFPKKLTTLVLLLSLLYSTSIFVSFLKNDQIKDELFNFVIPATEHAQRSRYLIEITNLQIENYISGMKNVSLIEIQKNLRKGQRNFNTFFALLKKNQFPIENESILDYFHHQKKTFELLKINNKKQAQKHFQLHVSGANKVKILAMINKTNEELKFMKQSDLQSSRNSFRFALLCSGILFALMLYSAYRIYMFQKRSGEKIKEAEDDLEQERMHNFQNAKLASIGELASGVAHEINNPLTIISGNVNRMLKLKKVGELTDEKFYLGIDKINQTIKRITLIINSLRKLSRDTSTDQITPVDAQTLVNETLDFISEKMKNYNIKLTVENHLSEQTHISCRSLEIQQILINLVNNSFDEIKNTPAPWVKIELSTDNKFDYISVIDSGQGIAKEKQEKIMQPFFTTKAAGIGTGLGLSISKRLANQNNGDLYIDNKCPNTKFVIRLPKNDPQSEKTAA